LNDEVKTSVPNGFLLKFIILQVLEVNQ
jgi:hypothetical protein